MQLTELLAQHVLAVHQGQNWTEVDLASVLHDVSLVEATALTAASPNTIATLLHHLTVWNRVMVRRTQGLATELAADNGFAMAPLLTEAAWAALQADNLASAHELAAAIRGFAEEKLAAPILANYSSAYKNLQGSVEHIHYHLGQIVLLKSLVRHQPPNGNP